MKKRQISILLAAVLLSGGCSAPAGQQSASTAAVGTEVVEEIKEERETEEKQEAETAEQADWTVLVYLCGTDLESGGGFASMNLEGLAKVPHSEHVNFVIQTGGTKEWKYEGINPEVIQRFTMDGGTLTEVEALPLANMGDPETFGGFLSWGVEQYPADRYMAVVWDHGGGPLGGAVADEWYQDSIMSVPELAKAFSMADAKFEIIGFDACLMASLEIANELSPYGNYLIASEEVEPGSGWDYERFGTYLAENPECDSIRFAQEVCDAFLELNKSEGGFADLLTLSVVNLNHMDPLVEAFDAMAEEMSTSISDIPAYRDMVQGIRKTEKYYEGSSVIDLGDMVKKAKGITPDTTRKVNDALHDAVIYSVHGDTRRYSNGISVMYDPGLHPLKMSAYADICPSPAYLAYLDAVNYRWRAPEWVYEKTSHVPELDYNDAHASFELSLNQNMQGALNITKNKEAVVKAVYKLFRFDTKNDRAYCLGDSDKLDGDFEKGTFVEQFDGNWLSIGGEYCLPHEIDSQDGYILYEIPVIVFDRKMYLRAAYIREEGAEEGRYELYGLWNTGNTAVDVISRDTIPLEDGMEITFVFPETSMDLKEVIDDREGGTIVYDSEKTKMEKRPIKDGTYALAFEVTDITGDKQSSEPVMMFRENGVMKKMLISDFQEEFSEEEQEKQQIHILRSE